MQLVNRSANITDLSFIYSCLLYGARKGHYSFDADNPEIVHQMKKEIQSVITRQLLQDERYAIASIFTLNGKRVAVMILAETGLEEHDLEIYALSVARSFQNLGYGSQIIDGLLNQYPDTNIFARCSATSDQMIMLLEDRGFCFFAMDSDHKVLMKEAFVSASYIENTHP